MSDFQLCTAEVQAFPGTFFMKFCKHGQVSCRSCAQWKKVFPEVENSKFHTNYRIWPFFVGDLVIWPFKTCMEQRSLFTCSSPGSCLLFFAKKTKLHSIQLKVKKKYLTTALQTWLLEQSIRRSTPCLRPQVNHLSSRIPKYSPEPQMGRFFHSRVRSKICQGPTTAKTAQLVEVGFQHPSGSNMPLGKVPKFSPVLAFDQGFMKKTLDCLIIKGLWYTHLSRGYYCWWKRSCTAWDG